MIYSMKVTEPGLDPAGLFDYSKGPWVAISKYCTFKLVSAGALVDSEIGAGDTIPNGNIRKVIMKLCGFAQAGTGKLIGPDGSEIDTESFLSDLVITKSDGLVVAAG
jgi:hypothetical protein